jgi:homoserine kinase
VPVIACLQELKGKEGILGAVLSGAGPSVLMFLDPRNALSTARKIVAAHLSRKGQKADRVDCHRNYFPRWPGVAAFNITLLRTPVGSTAT